MYKLLSTGILCLFFIQIFAQQSENDSLKVVDFDEVIVNASRQGLSIDDIPQKVEIVSKELIEAVPNESVAELLKRVTNIDIIQYPGVSASIGMRGFSPSAHSRSYTLILINGNPMGTCNLASIDPEMIESIEIIKGPYSMLYGSDAMGGVINIITKKNFTETTGSATVKTGSDKSFGINGSVFGKLSESSKVVIGFSHQQQTQDYRIGANNLLEMTAKEEAILDDNSYGDVMKNSEFSTNQIYGRISQSIGKLWSVSAEGIYYIANDIETPGNYWGSSGQSKKDIERINVYVPVIQKSEKNSFEFSPYFTHEKTANYSDNSDTGFVSLDSKVRQYGIKMSDSYSFGKIKCILGSDWDVYDFISDRYSDKNVNTNPYNPDNKNSKLGVFAQVNYVNKNLSANVGGRYSYIDYSITADTLLKSEGSSASYNVFTPSAGIQYKFMKSLKVHVSYGKGFSVPDAFKMNGNYSISEYFPKWDYWYIKNYVGNPDLKPESSSTTDFGIAVTLPKKLLSADFTYFITNHKDKILEYTENDTTSFKNANNSKMRGLEVVVSTDLGALIDNKCKIELYGNFTRLFTNTVEETLKSSTEEDSLVVRDLLYARKANGNFGVFFDSYRGLSFRINARYMGARLEKDLYSKLRPEITAADYYVEGGYTAKDKILEQPDYLLFDLTVFYKIKKVKLGVVISNIFDENYTEKDGYNMPGRALQGSLTYSF